VKSNQYRPNSTKTNLKTKIEAGKFKILTDEVLYLTYAGTHTYTFKVVRKKSIYLLRKYSIAL
jgi:hypothetical protein